MGNGFSDKREANGRQGETDGPASLAGCSSADEDATGGGGTATVFFPPNCCAVTRNRIMATNISIGNKLSIFVSIWSKDTNLFYISTSFYRS